MLESAYQSHVIKELKRRFHDCLVLKNDTNYLQGIPDLLVLYRNRWAVLEVKAYADAPSQPNQDYYLNKLDSMSFAAMICPENEEEVLDDLSYAFGTRRAPRISQRI